MTNLPHTALRVWSDGKAVLFVELLGGHVVELMLNEGGLAKALSLIKQLPPPPAPPPSIVQAILQRKGLIL